MAPVLPAWFVNLAAPILQVHPAILIAATGLTLLLQAMLGK